MKRKFSFSSPQRRGPDDPWFRVGQIDVTTTLIVSLLALLFMALGGLSGRFVDAMTLNPESVRHGQVWRLITWALANVPGFFPLLSIGIFWFFGRMIELMFGRDRFLKFLLLVTVVPALAVSLLSFAVPLAVSAVVGLGWVQFAVVLAYIVERPRAMFFLGIPAWVMGIINVVMIFSQLIGPGLWGDVLLVLFVMVIALLATRAFGFGEEVSWIPKLALPKKLQKGRGAKRLIVVRGPWGETGLPSSDIASQAEMDRLLDKIAATGMDSLSGDEKRRLKAHSKRLRGDG